MNKFIRQNFIWILLMFVIIDWHYQITLRDDGKRFLAGNDTSNEELQPSLKRKFSLIGAVRTHITQTKEEENISKVSEDEKHTTSNLSNNLKMQPLEEEDGILLKTAY